MKKLQVVDMQGAATGEVDVPDALLETAKGGQAVHEAVVAHLAAGRAGTASTLRKGEVSGSNRKPWRQKGLGRSRAGYRQSPVWRGGGVAFGPHPRRFSVKVNRKVAGLAFRRAFSEKVTAGEIRVIESLALAEARTRLFAGLMKTLGIEGGALFVDEAIERNAALASRNLPDVELVRARDVNVYQLLRYRTVVITRAGMDVVKARLENRAGDAA
jgi:large subunit ribosomal protein L4